MLQKVYAFILYQWLGWRLEGEVPRQCPQVVLVFLPHTSNWDFVIGWLFIRAEQIKVTIFAKDAFYFFPLKYLYRYFNVTPIKRNKRNNFVDQAAALYDQGQPLWTAMAPEGTRSYSEVLRSGYYYFARKADIDVVVVGPDFVNKKFIVLPPRKVKATFEEDAAELIEFSRRCKGKRPELSI